MIADADADMWVYEGRGASPALCRQGHNLNLQCSASTTRACASCKAALRMLLDREISLAGWYVRQSHPQCVCAAICSYNWWSNVRSSQSEFLGFLGCTPPPAVWAGAALGGFSS